MAGRGVVSLIFQRVRSGPGRGAGLDSKSPTSFAFTWTRGGGGGHGAWSSQSSQEAPSSLRLGMTRTDKDTWAPPGHPWADGAEGESEPGSRGRGRRSLGGPSEPGPPALPPCTTQPSHGARGTRQGWTPVGGAQGGSHLLRAWDGLPREPGRDLNPLCVLRGLRCPNRAWLRRRTGLCLQGTQGVHWPGPPEAWLSVDPGPLTLHWDFLYGQVGRSKKGDGWPEIQPGPLGLQPQPEWPRPRAPRSPAVSLASPDSALPARFLGHTVHARSHAAQDAGSPSPCTHPVPRQEMPGLALPSCAGEGTRSGRDHPGCGGGTGATQASPGSTLKGPLWFPWGRLPAEAGPEAPGRGAWGFTSILGGTISHVIPLASTLPLPEGLPATFCRAWTLQRNGISGHSWEERKEQGSTCACPPSPPRVCRGRAGGAYAPRPLPPCRPGQGRAGAVSQPPGCRAASEPGQRRGSWEPQCFLP